MMKKKNIWILIACCIVLIHLLVFSPYIKAEILTNKYGHEFLGLELQTNLLDDADYLKVVDYDDQSARVFYVASGAWGCWLTFCKDRNGDWRLENWDCIWSTTGSADGFMWPYYR